MLEEDPTEFDPTAIYSGMDRVFERVFVKQSLPPITTPSKQSALELELERLLTTLTTGQPAEFKAAKKAIKRLWHADVQTFHQVAPLVFKFFDRFDAMPTPANQAAFCSGINLFVLSLGDDYFEVLATFVLKAIQSPHGHVREAIRHSADWLSMLLTSRSRSFRYPVGKTVTAELRVQQDEVRARHRWYQERIASVLDRYPEPSGLRAEYIEDLPPSIYKSLQLLWSEINRIGRFMHDHESSLELLTRRDKIRSELVQLLEVTQSDASIIEIEELIYEEQGTEEFHSLIALFDTGQSAIEFSTVLEVVTDAWNYFPHRSLNGRSPVELSEDRNK